MNSFFPLLYDTEYIDSKNNNMHDDEIIWGRSLESTMTRIIRGHVDVCTLMLAPSSRNKDPWGSTERVAHAVPVNWIF